MEIPKEMMTLDWGKLDVQQGIRLVFSRIRWENDGTESRLRIATEGNLDCIYEIRNKDTGAIDQAYDEQKGSVNCKGQCKKGPFNSNWAPHPTHPGYC